MKKCIVFIAINLLMLNYLVAQQAAKAAYAEIGGPGLFSVNYDMRFQKKEDGLGFRVGVGGFSLRNNSSGGNNERIGITTFPVGLTYLLGKNSKNYFESGVGATFLLLRESSGVDSEIFNTTFGHLYAGYRLQPANSGFLFRGGLYAFFTEGGLAPFAGISLGYKF